jgi:ArsR family transcriptional regulator, arsenate/arsenite/antimonite-responsive transcriptional repressor
MISAMARKEKELAMENLFSALADRTRLRLLSLMATGEVCVCFFVEVLNQSQPKISRHLAYLRNAGVVEARRDGKWMHYRIVEPKDANAARIFNEVRSWLIEDEEMKRDRERLVKVCCGVQVPVTLQRAPLPIGLQNGPLTYGSKERVEPLAEEEPLQPVRRNYPPRDANWLDYD